MNVEWYLLNKDACCFAEVQKTSPLLYDSWEKNPPSRLPVSGIRDSVKIAVSAILLSFLN